MLEKELEMRRLLNEEADRRREGLSSLITYLKKVNKDQSRRVQDAEVGVVVGVVCGSVRDLHVCWGGVGFWWKRGAGLLSEGFG